MKIIIIGGHFSPALSVIEKLIEKNDISYLGRKSSFEGDKGHSFEYRQIESLGIKFFPISTARIQRKFTRYSLVSFSKLPVGFFQSYRILLKVKPNLVLGFGGYLSIPVAVAAKFLNISVVIHEQTLEAGFANKFISRFADKVLISWESSAKFFPKEKTILTGIPLTNEIISAKKLRIQKKELPVIYVTGGSGGSHFLNDLVYENLEKILKNFYVVHQTGNSLRFNDYDLCLEKKKSLDRNLLKRYTVKKFFDTKEAAEQLANADFVIGRSGVNTVSELIYLEKPALLIPLPFGQKDEQLKNANFLKELGLAEVLNQKDLKGTQLIEKMLEMVKNLEKYKLKKKVLTLDAAEKIIKVLQDVSNKKKA